MALQTASGIFIILGLVFVGLFKRYNGEAQFFSVHSWLGAIAIAAYIAQYTAGETPPLCLQYIDADLPPRLSFRRSFGMIKLELTCPWTFCAPAGAGISCLTLYGTEAAGCATI